MSRWAEAEDYDGYNPLIETTADMAIGGGIYDDNDDDNDDDDDE